MERRFDHLLKMATEAAPKMRRCTRTARRWAWRLAWAVHEIRQNWNKEFLAIVASGGIDDWLDRHFDGIEALGDSRKGILEAIRLGCTEDEYARDGSLWLLKKLKISTDDRAARVLSEPDPETDEDALAQLKKAKVVITELRTQYRDLLRRFEVLEREFNAQARRHRLLERKALRKVG